MRIGCPSAPDDLLLRDLVRGLSTLDRPAPGQGPTVCRAPTLSVGVLGNPAHTPQPPAHCLRVCLGADPHAVASRGCKFLATAARREIDLTQLPDGRCPQGFAVTARATRLGGAEAVFVSVEGEIAEGPAPEPSTCGTAQEPRHAADESNLLGHVDTAARLVQRVGEILEENSGCADEVLQNYEQLNLIFDLTQQIAQVTEARAIEELLLQRVARLLGSVAVTLASADGECRVFGGAGGRGDGAVTDRPATDLRSLKGLIDEIRRTRQVRVHEVEGRQIIAGPLVRLDGKVDVVFADRALEPAAGGFSSGDMMLVESMLAFGGQIITNTEMHERLRRMSLEVTHAMVAAIDKKDHYTSGHSERGGFLTRLTAQELGVPLAEQQTMEWAGLLHDIGKIGIPEEILCKPGKLTHEEFEVIKQHPRMGYEILKPIASLGVILDGVLYHHEYPDGSGYPEGLKGDQIPLIARIIHVVDTFDALTSTRAYRQAFSLERALEIIRNERGVRVDAEVADAFFRAFERYCREEPEDFAARFPAVIQPEKAHAEP